MKYLICFGLVIVLLIAGSFPVSTTAYAQAPGGSTTSAVPFQVPPDWIVYQDVGGAWSLKHPAGWTVSESGPGRVEFKFDTAGEVEIVVEEALGLPIDNWLTIDLFASGMAEELEADPSTVMLEMGRWLRGVFGLFFAFEGPDPQTGLQTPMVIVVAPFGENESVRASFTAFDNDDKTTMGAVLASLTPGAAPVTVDHVPDQQTSTEVLDTGGPLCSPIVFAEGIDAQNQPVNPATSFRTGITAVQAVFDCSGIANGTEYGANWYVDGALVLEDSYTWDAGGQGTGASARLSNSSGFPEGQYKLELTVGDTVVGQGSFTVGQAAVPPEPISVPSTMPQPQPTEMLPVTTPAPVLLATPAVPVETPVLLPTPEAPVPTPEPPTPKPQGRSSQGRIVYTQFDGDVPSLWLMNVDGSGRVMIKDADHASDPSWSPNGTSIVFVGWDGNPRGGSGIYTMNADGGDVKPIWNEGSASYLDWSLPGQYIALTSVVAGTNNRRLIVYDGRAGQWLDIGPGEQGSFSPDADRLVAKSCVGGDCGLYIMNRDGSNKWRLTLAGGDAMPAWSPLGDQIAYASEKDGNWDIWMVNTDGSGNVRLTQDPGIDAMPAWLPDGSGIVYRSAAGGSWGIWVMNRDGTNPTKIIDSFAGNDWGRARLDVR